jgi:hypothetical protein
MLFLVEHRRNITVFFECQGREFFTEHVPIVLLESTILAMQASESFDSKTDWIQIHVEEEETKS